MDSGIAILSAISAGLIALIFAKAAVGKLFNFFETQGIIRDYKLFPEKMAPALAVLVLSLELATVVLVLIPSFRSVGALLAMALLVGYAAAIGINLKRGRVSIDCGCGGSGQGISPWHLLRNAIYAGIASLAAFLPVEQISGFVPATTCVMSIIMLWGAIMLFEQLLKIKAHIVVSDLR
ncbi:MauE/DoxX family redox-associated membrane protein [Alteromonas sp. C1M14]|uniref:MauE/DoxX family redox-associated membrane protein n=1 Tax=Alteromonas sp. C1M14 TaxID=2841567 RepID=UPI001C09F116|nr:MauE/DoxX family redox-associated membrane protein [Alteromonas sp. C1M14]MBU2979874.1 hypothetical protein [Alteromonas sp. C1M14]